MSVKLARIVKSNSHVDYIGRVIDALDADAPPSADDYGFAQFVSLPQQDSESEVVGVIYNTLLVNPDYGNFGPRLSPRADLAALTPDYLNEQGVLVGILLLGETAGGVSRQIVPRRVLPAHQEVWRMEADEVRRFHLDEQGRAQMHYYSQIMAHAGLFSVSLLEAIIEQLAPICEPTEKQRLKVLKQTLLWQRTVGGMRQ
jgi:hypothetical protein